MAANPQSRKWVLTVNNPKDCGLDHGRLTGILSLFCPDCFCPADETAGRCLDENAALVGVGV